MMKIRIELENGDRFEGFLDEKEIAFLKERVKQQQEFYRKYYPEDERKYNMATEIVCGIIQEHIRDPRYKIDR